MTQFKEPFVSVVTPVYNGEKYIAECIESVLAQTYNNWEYVIVNNCSTDRTLEIAESYAERDSRIRIHDNSDFLGHLENGDQAFKKMSPDSKYCKVIHADDWMFSECLSKMVEIAEEHPEVGIVSSYRLDDRRVNLDGLPYPSHRNNGFEIGREYLLNGTYYFGSPSSLLIRCDLIHKRDKLYDQSNVHSDVSACLDLLKESDLGFVHQVLTFTRRHNESVTDRISKKHFSYIVGRIKNLLLYGEHYLTEDELLDNLISAIEHYHEEMAGKFLLLRSAKVLRLAKVELNTVNVPGKYKNLIKIKIGKLIKALLIELLDLRRNVRWVRKEIKNE